MKRPGINKSARRPGVWILICRYHEPLRNAIKSRIPTPFRSWNEKLGAWEILEPHDATARAIVDDLFGPQEDAS